MQLHLIFWVISLASTIHGYYHTIVAPKEFRIGGRHKIVVNLHEYQGTATARCYTMTLPNRRNTFNTERKVQQDVNSPISFDIEIPPNQMVEERYKNTYVQMHVIVEDSSHDFHETFNMLVNFTNGYVFVSTDRPAYRPGDTVKVVAVVTDQSLLPDTNSAKVKIKIPPDTNSRRITVSETQRSMSTTNQPYFIKHEHTLAKDTVLGLWAVEVSIESLNISTEATFKVDRYVIPTFDVKIIMDRHYILRSHNSIKGKITAEYSYGQKIYGFYYLTARLIRPEGPPEGAIVFKEPRKDFGKARIRNGLRRFSIPAQNFMNNVSFDVLVEEEAILSVQASVTGYESVFESDIVTGIKFTKSPFVVSVADSSRYFLPGLTYNLKGNVKDSVTYDLVQNINVGITVGENTEEIVRTDDRGEFFHVISTNSNQEQIEIIITVPAGSTPQDENHNRIHWNIQKHDADSYLEILFPSEQAQVDRSKQVKFRFQQLEEFPPDFRYFVVSRGLIVHAGVKNIPHRDTGEQVLSIDITEEMVPSSRLVAYFIKNGEVISNSVWFDVEKKCDGTELKVSVGDDERDNYQLLPESNVPIRVQGNPNAFVHISAVDRAAYYVYNESRLTRDTLWNSMDAYDTSCSKEGGANGEHVFEEAGLFLVGQTIPAKLYESPVCETQQIRKKRSFTKYVSILGAEENLHERRSQLLELCTAGGKIHKVFDEDTCDMRRNRVLNNIRDRECAQLYFDACNRMRKIERILGISLGRATEVKGSLSKSSQSKTRSNFKENWLWLTERLSPQGVRHFLRTTPGSISQFDFTAISISDSKGFCVAKPMSIKIFKKVFIQLYLPYSLRLMEQANIRYSVFNYDPQAIRLRVSLMHSSSLCSMSLADAFHALGEFEVGGNSAISSYFTVIPVELPENGKTTIEMKAGSDHIQKELLIEPRGLQRSSSRTWVINPDESPEISFEFDIPAEGFEPLSRECWIYTFGHSMGPAVEMDPNTRTYKDLQELLEIPAGCGEQNMKIIAPDVYILKYRLAVGQVEADGMEAQTIVGYIKKGYEIELKWRSDQVNRVAFAVWNTSPPSTWLNAFVVKVFTEARQYYPEMDTLPICSSLTWLLTQTHSDGHFVESYPVWHKEMDGLVEGDVAMTAYVAVTLGELGNGNVCPNLQNELTIAKTKAYAYLQLNALRMNNNAYAYALSVYAMAIGNPDELVSREWNQRLLDMKHEENNLVYWNGPGGREGNIETTGYALMAQVALARVEGATSTTVRLTKKISNWLISQRNDLGGWVSTQDTVVALQALALYMTWAYEQRVEPPLANINVQFASNQSKTAWYEEHPIVHINGENALTRNTTEVPSNVIGTRVTANIEGTGEGSLSYRCIWRQNLDSTNCPFDIIVKTESSDDFETLILNIKVTKREMPAAGMSIIDIGLLSGYHPITKTLDDLVEGLDRVADRYEIANNSIIFYVNKIDRNLLNLYLTLERKTQVEKPLPAAVTVYEYYKRESTCTKFYSNHEIINLRTSCVQPNNQGNHLCTCAEGRCLKCRTRQEIRDDTQCLQGRPHKFSNRNKKSRCQTCKKRVEKMCFNGKTNACRGQYLYRVNVTRIHDDESGFVRFDAEILKSSRTGVDSAEKGDVKHFKVRKDCFEACKDENIDGTKVDIISVGRNLMISGQEPEYLNSSLGFSYYLDEQATIEVAMPMKKCNRLWKVSCNKKQRKCAIKMERKKICNSQKNLEFVVHQGCD